jgi:DNA-directed RNA polymerase specialized sigma24 family protein
MKREYERIGARCGTARQLCASERQYRMLSGKLPRVTLLGDVQAAAERFHRAEAELEKAREELRAAMVAAHDEGVPTARLAREAGISRPTAHEWLKRR